MQKDLWEAEELNRMSLVPTKRRNLPGIFFMKDERLNNIVKILKDELYPEKLILFGSRGKGNALFNSDYDIAVSAESITLSGKRKLKEKVDSIIGLHKIDIVFLNEVDEGFRNIIERKGKVIYER